MADNDWQTLINAARTAGYGVYKDDDAWWFVITPKAPRHPSQTLGGFKSEQAAWKSAAFLRHSNP